MIKKAIILSAGYGKRMGEATKDIPKVMLKVAGKPLLEHQINLLRSYGVKEICINLHYLPQSIIDFFGDGSDFGVKIYYNFEPELLGTSGALSAFKEILNEDFFVIYGDVLGKVDLHKLEEFHNTKRSAGTLIVHPSNHPEDSDIAQVKEDGQIIKLIKKPGNKEFGILGNAAWYICTPCIYDYLSSGSSDFIRDVFPRMIEKGLAIYGYETDEFISDVGTPERFALAEKYFMS